jgi:hypothetical protein
MRWRYTLKRIETEEDRLRLGERSIRSEVAAFAEWDETSCAGRKITSCVSERECGDREVRQQVDTFQTCGLNRGAVRAFVQSPQRWGGARDHVADAGPSAADRRREAEGLCVGLVSDAVRQCYPGVRIPAVCLASIHGVLRESLGGVLRETGLPECLDESGEGLPSAGRIVGRHAVQDPLERAGAAAG